MEWTLLQGVWDRVYYEYPSFAAYNRCFVTRPWCNNRSVDQLVNCQRLIQTSDDVQVLLAYAVLKRDYRQVHMIVYVDATRKCQYAVVDPYIAKIDSVSTLCLTDGQRAECARIVKPMLTWRCTYLRALKRIFGDSNANPVHYIVDSYVCYDIVLHHLSETGYPVQTVTHRSSVPVVVWSTTTDHAWRPSPFRLPLSFILRARNEDGYTDALDVLSSFN